MIAATLTSCAALTATAYSPLRHAATATLRMAAKDSIDGPVDVLRRCGANCDDRPTPEQATEALALVANAGVRPPAWLPVLSAGSWRPIFSATPDALKAAAADGRAVPRPPGVANARPGRMYFPSSVVWAGCTQTQSFTADGQLENTLRLWRGVLSFSFCGAFDLTGRRMSIRFETLRVALLFGWIRLNLDIREGRGLRAFIERWLRPRGTNQKKKRPNTYAWCYADESLCVAAGSSGSVAVWEAVPATGGPNKLAGAAANAAQPRAPRAGDPKMSWSDPDWSWGSATGKAHDAARQLRESLDSPEARQQFVTGLGMMDPEDWEESKLVLALKIQRAAKRCYGKAHGLDQDEQSSWRALVDAMAACEFEGYRGDLRLAEAIIERLGLSEGKRVASL